MLPKLYSIYLQNMTSSMSALFLIFYIYPAFDLLFYSLTLLLGTKIDQNLKGFFSQIHFFLIGYGAGMVLLVGYTEV
jgi:hypothetical protein